MPNSPNIAAQFFVNFLAASPDKPILIPIDSFRPHSKLQTACAAVTAACWLSRLAVHKNAGAILNSVSGMPTDAASASIL